MRIDTNCTTTLFWAAVHGMFPVYYLSVQHLNAAEQGDSFDGETRGLKVEFLYAIDPSRCGLSVRSMHKTNR